MTVTVTMLIHTFCFWVPGAVLAAVDLTKWPASLYACKIQAKTDVTLSTSHSWRVDVCVCVCVCV